MDVQPIVIILEHKEICIPEQVEFKTVFLLNNPLTLTNDLAQANKNFLHFLSTTNLSSGEAQSASMDANGVEYTCPSYLITLTYATYLLLEKYRDEHPEVAGFVVSRTFSRKDQDSFLTNLSTKARQMAEKKAQQRNVILGDVLEMEEIKSEPTSWVVHPPLSARLNHFQQAITGQYRLVFSVQTQPD